MFASLCPAGKVSFANMQSDHVGDRLRLGGGKGKRIAQPAAKLIARGPALVRGFAFLGHGSCFSCDKRVQALCRDDSAPANAPREQAARCYVRIDRGAAQAGRLAGFLDGIGDLGGIVFFGSH